MHIAMSFPQSQRHEAQIGGQVVRFQPQAHALLEILLMNRGLWVDWTALCGKLDILPHPGWRQVIHHAVEALRREGLSIENRYRTGYRLPLDISRLHKLEVVP